VSRPDDYLKDRKRRQAAATKKNGTPQAPAPRPQRQQYGPSDPEPWARPVPFNRPSDVPPFPARLLPPWLAEWVMAEAEATQTPPDLAGNLALAVAAAAIARKVRVRVRGNWTEPANIFAVVSLPPGERKSAVFGDATAPLLEFEQQEKDRLAPIIAELASEHRVMEAKLKALESKAAKAEGATEADRFRQEAKQFAKDLAAHYVPDEPQLFCDDVTPEKLAQLIVRQGGRMLLASPEGTAFEIAKGRYSETANFDVFLKGHAGDPLRVGRVVRDSESVNQPALSCALAVQPDVISGLAEQASMRGRGFLARWLYSCPPSMVGKRKTAPAPVPEQVVRRYQQGMFELWGLQSNTLAGVDCAWEMELSRGADDALRALESWLEPQLAEGAPLSCLAGWANKLAGAVARLSVIMHMAGTLGVRGTWNVPIGRKTVEAAVAIGRDYYLPHARAAFGLMGSDERSKDAARVVGWLVARLKRETVKVWKGVVTVTKRDIHSEVFGGSRTVEQVDAVCRLLVEHGFLRPAGPARRRDSHLFEINPEQGESDSAE
jgi:replicative DNA helicase